MAHGDHDHDHGHDPGHGHADHPDPPLAHDEPPRNGGERPPAHGDLLYFDCISGAAGDMLMASLIDLGAGDAIEAAVAALGIAGARIERRTVERSGIRALHIDVRWADRQPPRDHAAIQELLAVAPLDPEVRRRASATFRKLAEAEGDVHGVPPDRVHFHEVGSVDAIVDVVGVCAGLASLGARVIASPLPLGSGLTRSAHGPIPVPAPATLALLRGVPVQGTDHDKELVTPTGAALLVTAAESWGPLPPMRPRAIGWGAGTWELSDRPNVVRAVLGDAEAPSQTGGAAFVVIEANLDDMTPEVAAYAAEAVRRAGALDVWLVPCLMKKGRPGIELCALARTSEQGAVAHAVLRETTTLGVRVVSASRIECDRDVVEVETPWGAVRVKVGRLHGEPVNVAPEYEACREVAERAGIPLKRVMAEALAAYFRT